MEPSIPEKSQREKLQNIALVLLVIVAAFLLQQNFMLKKDVDTAKKASTSAGTKLEESQRLFAGELQTVLAYERPVVDPLGSLVYIPELRIKLPLNDATKTLLYSMRSDKQISDSATEADVTSSFFVPPDKQTVMNCSNLVRLKVEAKANPYSPHEKPTSVTLTGGRTLQVYESFNLKECTDAWNNSISPATIAAEFKNAQSY